jgi:hypothetical protein
VSYGTPSGRSVAVDDLDGDGALDIVTADGGQSSLSSTTFS